VCTPTDSASFLCGTPASATTCCVSRLKIFTAVFKNGLRAERSSRMVDCAWGNHHHRPHSSRARDSLTRSATRYDKTSSYDIRCGCIDSCTSHRRTPQALQQSRPVQGGRISQEVHYMIWGWLLLCFVLGAIVGWEILQGMKR
jgi:hypothetical protein